MPFQNIIFHLTDDYSFELISREYDFEVQLLYQSEKIGYATLLSDQVDVVCITHLEIYNNQHISKKIDDTHTLGQAFIKLLIKFPFVIRKPPFRFFLNYPENLIDIFSNYHLDQGKDSPIENKIMIRKERKSPENITNLENICIIKEIKEEYIEPILSLLKQDTYWQEHLTRDQFEILIKNSQCFVALKDNKVIGFSRVLTNKNDFASLWDVVVAKEFQGKRIGTYMMQTIFSDPEFNEIKNWVLYTDTAASFYQKFGFIVEKELPYSTLIHKLRFNALYPIGTSELIQQIKKGFPISLSSKKSREFLFEMKRKDLFHFWNSGDQNEGTGVKENLKFIAT